jgi:hypothetical protein
MYVKVFSAAFPKLSGFLSILSQWSTWEPMPALVSALLILAGLAAFSGLLWKHWWSRWWDDVDPDHRAAVLFWGKRLSAISDEDGLIFRLARKFMPASYGEGWHVTFWPFFSIVKTKQEVSLAKKDLSFMSEPELTPTDSYQNWVVASIQGRIDPEELAVASKYPNDAFIIKRMKSVVDSLLMPWISTKDPGTPQTWKELRQKSAIVRQIVIRALLQNFGEEGIDVEAELKRALDGKEFRLPKLGIIVELATVHVISEARVVKAEGDISLEGLQRTREVDEAKTVVMRAKAIVDPLFRHIADETARMSDPDYREEFIRQVELLRAETLTREGFGKTFVIQGSGGGGSYLPAAQLIADALGGSFGGGGHVASPVAPSAPEPAPRGSGSHGKRRKK